jgi:hypothetical protein
MILAVKVLLLFLNVLCREYSVESDFDYTPLISNTYYRVRADPATMDYNFHKVPSSNCTTDECAMYVTRASVGLHAA